MQNSLILCVLGRKEVLQVRLINQKVVELLIMIQEKQIWPINTSVLFLGAILCGDELFHPHRHQTKCWTSITNGSHFKISMSRYCNIAFTKIFQRPGWGTLHMVNKLSSSELTKKTIFWNNEMDDLGNYKPVNPRLIPSTVIKCLIKSAMHQELKMGSRIWQYSVD